MRILFEILIVGAVFMGLMTVFYYLFIFPQNKWNKKKDLKDDILEMYEEERREYFNKKLKEEEQK